MGATHRVLREGTRIPDPVIPFTRPTSKQKVPITQDFLVGAKGLEPLTPSV